MIIKPLQAGQTVELRHPLAGAIPLDLHSKLRVVKLNAEEIDLYRQVKKQKADLSEKASAYSATKLRDQLEEAKAEIRENITEEGLENVARLAALATDQTVARAVELEAHAAIAPELARLDSQLIPICDRLIAEVKTALEKAVSKFNFNGLTDFIADDQLGQIGSYISDRVAASHSLLDAWAVKARSDGALAFLADDRQA